MGDIHTNRDIIVHTAILGTMHFPELTHRSRARTKSVQFDRVKAMFTSRESLTDEEPSPLARPASVPAPLVPARRSVSLNLTHQENAPSVRRYKSMLDVEGPPRLPATSPMTYDELYVEALPQTIPTPATRTLEIAKYWKSPHTTALATHACRTLVLSLLVDLSLLLTA